MKTVILALIIILLSGCAKGRLDVYNSDGEIVGECIAQYNWHLYGVKDSVNYLLNICAQQAHKEGNHIKDEVILNTDFTLPSPPDGKQWNKLIAMEQFKSGELSEQKLGYILSAIEYEYALKEWAAEAQLAKGEISQDEFDKLIKEAKYIWYGK